MDDVVNRAFITVNAACNAAGIRFGLRGVDENISGDEGCHGYIDLEGIDIYPQLVATRQGNQIGWGVSIGLDNGDVQEVCAPFVNMTSIAYGKVLHPRTIMDAADKAILALVSERLRAWHDSEATDEYAKEFCNGNG